MLRRSLRVLGTILITGSCVAYLLWKIDVLTGKASAAPKPEDATLPLFPESVLDASESTLSVAISA
jgi:hypothetical protein